MNGFVICGKPQFSGERVKVPLGSLGKVVTGNTPSKKNESYWATEDVPFIKPGDIDESAVTYLADGTEYIADCAIGKARCVGAGSVLVTCIGTIAKIAVVNCNCIAFNQQINAIDVDRNVIDPQYLAYALKANNTRLKMLANAPVVPIINKRQFESFVLPVHSDLNVQREIVSQFTAIGSQRQGLDEELCHLDNLVKSRFIEMFGDALNSDNRWPERTLGSMLDIARGGSPRPIKSYLTSDPAGINWIKIGDAVNGSRYIENTAERIKPSGAKKSRLVHSGDFLLSNSMSFGRPYILKTEGCIHDGWLVLQGVDEYFNSLFLYQLLASDDMLHRFRGLVRGGVVNNLNKDLVSTVSVMVPPIGLQRDFATFVQQVDKLRFMLLGNPSPIYRSRSFCCSTNSDNGGLF